MDIECVKIILELEKYETLISEFITITGQAHYSLFSGLSAQINSLKESCSDEQIKEKDEIEKLSICFNELEDSAYALFNYIMQNIAADNPRASIDNYSGTDRKQIDILSESVENFRCYVQELNESFLVALKGQKSTLESQQTKSKSVSIKLERVNAYIEKIEENLSILNFGKAEIDDVLQSVKIRRKKPVVIPERSDKVIHNVQQASDFTLRKNIEELYKQFTILAEQNATFRFAHANMDKLGQHNIALAHSLALFQKTERRSKQLIAKTKGSWSKLYHAIKTEHHQDLFNELNAAIEELSALNNKKITLKKEILSKQKQLVPSEISLAELTACLEQEKDNLHKNLEHFLSIFSILDLHNSKDADNRYFIELLQKFIELLSNELQAYDMPLNHQPVAEFVQTLQQHIGEKLKWHWLSKDDIKPISMQSISDFLNDLFAQPTYGFSDLLLTPGLLSDYFDSSSLKENQKESLRNQIIALRSLTDNIKQFPISAIKDHHTLKTLQKKQGDEISRKFEQLQINIDTSINGLGNRISLLSSRFTSSPKINNGYMIIAELERLKGQIVAHFEEYDKKSQELSTIESPLERLAILTDLQESFLHDLAKFESEFRAENGLNNHAVKVQLELITIYATEKNKLISDLRSSISNTQAALGVYHKEEEIREKLTLENKVLEDLIEANQPLSLFKIEFEVGYKITALQKQIEAIRARIKEEYRPGISALEHQLSTFNTTALSADNPFLPVLAEQQNLASLSIERVNSELNALDKRLPTDFLKAVDELKKTVTEAKTSLQTLNKSYSDALIIQQRMTSKEHLMSLDLIAKLEDEFVRLLDERHINAAIEKYPDEQQNFKVFLQNPLALFQENNPGKDQADLLDKIDLRLNKLRSIANEFKLINQDYINRDLDFNRLSSERIKPALEKEFLEIFLNHIDEALISNPDNQELKALKSNPKTVIGSSRFNEETRELLNLIHPRLAVLCLEICNNNQGRFDSTNKRYIDLLLHKVETHIHHSNMEHFSEGKHSDFVQFIRLYILKPVQSLTHYLGSKISMEADARHRFFTTIGATKTEDLLVVTGNELYMNLAAAGA